MKFLPEITLTRKLILTMMTTSSVSLLVACGLFLSYDVITLRHSIAEHLDSLAHITGANVVAALTYNDPKSADLVLEALEAEPNIVAARIYDGRGRAFASYRRLPSGSLAQLPDLAPAISDQLERDQVTECAAILFDGESIGAVYLVSDLQEIHRRLRRFIVFVLILMAASSAAAFLVAILLKHLISRPILDLVETTKTISREKNFGVRAPKYADDEVGLLVDGLNEMLRQIEVAQSALRAAHAESELFINSVPSVLIGTDSLGQITRWNSAAATVCGLPADTVLGKRLQDCGIYWSQPQTLDIESWFRVERTENRENVMFEKDGHKRFLGLTIINVDLIPGGKGTGFLITGADITERKILEEQLRQAQKLEAIGQLAAGIAHEINTPAQYVGDNARFLQEMWPTVDRTLALCMRLREESVAGSIAPETIAELLLCTEKADPAYLLQEVPQAIAQTLEGVQRVSKIVKAMKEFSHPGSEGKSAIDINHAIETTIAVARNEWKYVAEVQTCFAADLPPVPCLAGEFNQVILNLLINAAHAIAAALGAGSAAKGTITITTKCADDWAEVQIKDTGSGVPENIRGRIFEPFFTTKEVGKGTGQGLALAHTVIVKKHAGQIWFESETGKGTTFFLRLPLGPSETLPSPAAQATAKQA
jgi:PAS domain S-box-containing protein